MTMEWNSRNEWFNPNGGNGRDSFQEHDECMREFRGAHANIAMVNGLRYGESALLETMEPLQVRRTMIETGGTRLPNGITDWSALVPLWKVAGYKISQN